MLQWVYTEAQGLVEVDLSIHLEFIWFWSFYAVSSGCVTLLKIVSCFFLVTFQFSHSVMSTVWNPMDCSTPCFPVHHKLPEFTQTHVHQVGDAIQSSNPLLFPSPPTVNLSQHQGLFQWVNSSHQVAKVLEFQLQHQSFQWKYRTDLL